MRQQDQFAASLDDDLNISGALGALFDMVHAATRLWMRGRGRRPEAWATLALFEGFDTVLGFLRPMEEEVDPAVLEMVELRQQARRNKNWAEADRLREELAARGWTVKDTAKGPELKRL